MKRKHLTSRLFLTFVALAVSLSSVSVSLANHEGDEALSHIVVSTPGTYSQCVDAVTSDVISITNVQDPDTGEPWTLQGQIIVQYVVDATGSRETVPGGAYPINQVGDLEIEIFYPPVSDWPVFIDPSTGLPVSEIHVDIQIEVFSSGGVKLGELGLGPGHDWDVFCLTPPPPPPTGIDGCTPGFWKNHQSAWEQTAYAPTNTVGSVFTIPSTLGSLSGDSLLSALGYGGGRGEEGAAKILLRASVAALLNASHSDVEYPDSASSVISQVNAALATADRDTMLDLATELDNQNNLGCPIDG